MNHWTIIPQRGLATGKARLADVLGARERRALNARLLKQALAAVADSHAGLARVVVASAGEDTLEFARGAGAWALADPPGARLNEALENARDVVRERGANSILVMSADLPHATRAAVAHLRGAVPEGDAAIVADKHGTGTNALLLPAALPLSFAFGPGSLARHVEAVDALGVRVLVWRDPALALDIDLPGEYAAWAREAA